MNKAGACLYAEVGRGQKGGAAFRTTEEVPPGGAGAPGRHLQWGWTPGGGPLVVEDVLGTGLVWMIWLWELLVIAVYDG
eukprot:Skav221144  [mRNA]  locus=scaffold2925:61988:62224:+ [translate_table: standard]